MDLIEKLGLEKCKQIVDGAPNHTTHVIDSSYLRLIGACWWMVWKFDGCSNNYDWKGESIELMKTWGEVVKLSDLRTAIADHERTDNCSDIKNHISPNTKVIKG